MVTSGVNEYRFCGANKAASRIDTRGYNMVDKYGACQMTGPCRMPERTLPKATFAAQPLGFCVTNSTTHYTLAVRLR